MKRSSTYRLRSAAPRTSRAWQRPKIRRLVLDRTIGGAVPERGEDETYFGIPIGTRPAP